MMVKKAIHSFIRKSFSLLGCCGVDSQEAEQQLVLIEEGVVVPLDIRAIGVGVSQDLGKGLQDGVCAVKFGERKGVVSSIL